MKRLRCLIVFLIFIAFIFCGYQYISSDNMMKKEVVRVIKSVFGIDISELEFEYENTLNYLKTGGNINVQLEIDKNTKNKWERYCSENMMNGNDMDFAIRVANELEVPLEEITGNIYVKHTHGTVRNLIMEEKFRYTRQECLWHYMYIKENTDKTAIVYIFYNESKYGFWEYTVVRIIVYIVLLIVLFIVVRKIRSRERLRMRVINIIKRIFDIDISKMTFDYKNSLKYLLPKGELIVYGFVDDKLKKEILEQYSDRLCASNDSDMEVKIVSRVFDIAEKETNGKIAILDSKAQRMTGFGTAKSCNRILFLQEKGNEKTILHLYYKEI